MSCSQNKPLDSVHFKGDRNAIFKGQPNSVKDWLRNHPEKYSRVEVFLGDRKEFVSVREYLADF